jgi:hypothetical protein
LYIFYAKFLGLLLYAELLECCQILLDSLVEAGELAFP